MPRRSIQQIRGGRRRTQSAAGWRACRAGGCRDGGRERGRWALGRPFRLGGRAHGWAGAQRSGGRRAQGGCVHRQRVAPGAERTGTWWAQGMAHRAELWTAAGARRRCPTFRGQPFGETHAARSRQRGGGGGVGGRPMCACRAGGGLSCAGGRPCAGSARRAGGQAVGEGASRRSGGHADGRAARAERWAVRPNGAGLLQERVSGRRVWSPRSLVLDDAERHGSGNRFVLESSVQSLVVGASHGSRCESQSRLPHGDEPLCVFAQY